jgi:hypothetical protein
VKKSDAAGLGGGDNWVVGRKQDEFWEARQRYEWEMAEAVLGGRIVPHVSTPVQPTRDAGVCEQCGKQMQWIPWSVPGFPWREHWPGGSVGLREVCAECRRLGEFDAQMIIN